MWDLMRDFYLEYYFISFGFILASCILGLLFVHSEEFGTRLLFTLLVILASTSMLVGLSFSNEAYRALCLIVIFVGVFSVAINVLFAAGTKDAGSTIDTVRWIDLDETESIRRGYIKGKIYLGFLLLMNFIDLTRNLVG